MILLKVKKIEIESNIYWNKNNVKQKTVASFGFLSDLNQPNN